MIILSTTDHRPDFPVTYETYPGGELRLSEIPDAPFESVFAHLDNAADIVALGQVKSALDRMRDRRGIAPVLYLPYVPYARQDRANELPGNQVLAARWMCEQINMQKWLHVNVADVHSDVTLALLDNVIHTERKDLICTPLDVLHDQFEISERDIVLVAPDAGARKSVEKIAEGRNFQGVLTAQKVRDMKTGTISGTIVQDVKATAGAHVLIADDICDGGRTFFEVARAIRQDSSPESISLYVTHGLFSKGMSDLLGLFDNIFCPFPWEKFRYMDGKGWGDFTSAAHDRVIGNDFDYAFPHFDSLTITRK